MLKKMQKSDYFFIIAMLAGLFMHLLCLYGADHFADESFFPTIPLRLINGESLVQDEWHLTQFTSVFLYLPVRIWLAIKGSTEGIILFLRCFYLTIHTAVAIGLYAYFRKQKIWAVVAALIFYTQVPLRFMSANYHSLLALSLLLFTLTLVTLCEKDNIFLYLFAGFCFGCGCICNPFTCALFVVYILLCLVRRRKQGLSQRFFSLPAFLKFSAGIAIAAVMLIVFFFATGGTISSLLENIPNLLTDTGHNIFASPMDAFLEKLARAANVFHQISFGVPFLLPVLYVALLLDKKRKVLSHKLVYLGISFAMAIFYIAGVAIVSLGNSRAFALSLPLAIVTSVCYILTEQKNKKLFYCMWLPGLIATFVQFCASDLILTVFWVLTISNIAGVFFMKDFLKETLPEKSSIYTTCKVLCCLVLCLQLTFQCVMYSWGRTVNTNASVQLSKGPYAGFYLSEETHANNCSVMQDLDVIKERSAPDDSILIISEFSWMYLYIDRPFATYSAWQPWLETQRLKEYYESNPDKTPKYIYVGWTYIPTSVTDGHMLNPDRAQLDADVLKKMFDCEQENLSAGILLTVKE